MRSSPIRTWGLFIFLLTLLVRAERLRFLPFDGLSWTSPTPYGPGSPDEGINIAYSIHAGNGFANPFRAGPTGATAHCAPSFPIVTAALFVLFGTGEAGAIARDLLNIAGYGLLFALLPFFAAKLGITAAPGVISGIAAAVYPHYGFSEIMRGRDEWLAALGGMLLLVAALRIARERDLRRSSALIYGAGWGALMYAYPGMVTILPAHLLIILFARKRTAGRRLAFAAVSLAAFLLVILPWTIRNRIVMGAWMFMRDDLGLELTLSNGDGAHATVEGNLTSGWLYSIHPSYSRAANIEVLQSGEVEFNRRLMTRTTSWIRHHPARFGSLTVRRFAAFWLGSPQNVGFMLFSAVLTLLGAVGLGLMWRRGLRTETTLLSVLWVVYPLAYYAIERVDRYQIPIYPALLLPAGYAVVTIYFAFRNSMVRGSKKRSTTLSFSGIIPLSVM